MGETERRGAMAERERGMKVVLIGAGSAVFTKGLVADLLASPELGPWQLGLVDIDPEALEVAEGLSRRMVTAVGGAASGAEVTVRASEDRRDLLPGADVVVTTIGVGGRRAWEADVFIPRKYGVYQPVGDTVMPGGISRAMRMIPALVAIARDVAELCPEAWFLNYSNPMTANCWAVREASGVPVMGLCHGTFDVSRQLAQFVGAPPHETTTRYAGLNHLTFIHDLRWRGRDMWPTARHALLPPTSGEGVAKPPALGGGSFAADNPFSWSLFEAYGAYPSANDRHVAEFFPERFPRGRYYGKTLGVDAYSFEGTIAGGDREYAKMREQALGQAPLDEWIFRHTVGEHEQLLHIIRALRYDTREVFAVNLPNGGAVPNLPEDAILEIPAVATAVGLLPIQTPDFSDALAGIIARRLASTRITVEAALTGDRTKFVEALLLDGAVTDPEAARAMMEELLQAQRAYLPSFFPEDGLKHQ
jgi:alpha-galactosidase